MSFLKLGLRNGELVLLDKNNEVLFGQFELSLKYNKDSVPIVNVSFVVDTKEIL